MKMSSWFSNKYFGLIVITIWLGLLVVTPTAQAHGLELKVSPTNPQPEERITVELTGSSRVINQADEINWLLSGDYSDLERSRTNISLTTGQLGTQVSITARVVLRGQVVELNEVIRPSVVDILWESGGYIPPFYSGRSLPISQGEITLTALFRTSSAVRAGDNLVFLWRLNGIRVAKAERGLDSITLAGSQLRHSPRISVEVSDLEGNRVGRNEINLNLVDPQVIVTADDSLLGTRWEKAVFEGFRMPQRRTTFTAWPLFFNTSEADSNDLNYRWQMNNRLIKGENKPTITFQTPTEPGRANISVFIQHSDLVLANTKKEFEIIFD